ncbi:hypothetical protein Vretifemale_19272 [Volvox reticuliferus]|nr:hypothetical protein Vretifemale_19272 [Volvox reticuliferus]
MPQHREGSGPAPYAMGTPFERPAPPKPFPSPPTTHRHAYQDSKHGMKDDTPSNPTPTARSFLNGKSGAACATRVNSGYSSGNRNAARAYLRSFTSGQTRTKVQGEANPRKVPAPVQWGGNDNIHIQRRVMTKTDEPMSEPMLRIQAPYVRTYVRKQG